MARIAMICTPTETVAVIVSSNQARLDRNTNVYSPRISNSRSSDLNTPTGGIHQATSDWLSSTSFRVARP